MPAAVIGGAIAAAGAVGSAVIANKGASKAADATQAAADQSAQVQREIYSKNAATLSPYVQAGIPATNAINALLGLGGVPVMGMQASGQTQPAMSPEVMQMLASNDFPGIFGMGNRLRNSLLDQAGAMQGGNVNTPVQPSAQQQYQNAFDNYRNSTGYQFRLNQGLNAVNSGYAGAGTVKSGAAMKAINDYGQGMASQEFGNYLAALGNQQGLGLSAASAQAGVGQNYANSLSNIYQANAGNQANAALLKSQNMGQALNTVGMIGGNLLGSMGRASQPALMPVATTSSILRG